MSSSQIIVLVTPLFLLLIAAEYAVGRHRGRPGYRLDDAINSLSLGMLSQITGVLGGLLTLGLYTLVYRHAALVQAEGFWTHPVGWLLALVFYDFCYYWLHRLGHEVAVLWAAHVVHHQSQSYNLSTALRQTSTGFLLGWLFYVPMALAGVPPLVFVVVGLIDLLYQFWVHTEQVGRLGGFDRWFCSPSNHRVHHAVNDRYLDKNYGGILMVWDRLFGTFEAEDPAEPCVYGTRAPLNSWDPLWANLQVYRGLVQDCWRTQAWGDKLRVWLKPPGWQPADLAARHPYPRFELARVQRYATPLNSRQQAFAGLQFVLTLAATAAFLWWAPDLGLTTTALGGLALAVTLWAQGAHLQQRLGAWACLMVQAGALATLSSALGWSTVHWVAKPAAMMFALIFVATHPAWTRDKGHFHSQKYALILALSASLLGDVLLMLSERLFVGGLAAFLLAHLAYLAVFSRGVGWWPDRRPLGLTLGIGVLMYAVLWPGLPTALRGPVAAYVLAIAAMVAQALGRAIVLGNRAAWTVGWGALAFMLSDALLGLNRFVQPLPLAPLWVLSSYYLAQVLIVWGLLAQPSDQDGANKSPAAFGGTTPR